MTVTKDGSNTRLKDDQLDTLQLGEDDAVRQNLSLLELQSDNAQVDAGGQTVVAQPEGANHGDDVLNGDFLDDAQEVVDRHGKGGHGHGHKTPQIHFALLLVFLALVIGCFTNCFLERCLPSLPYTCVLFVEGFALSMLQEMKLLPTSTLDSAVENWQHVDAHFCFYVLLTPLVFADAMSMNVSMLKHCFWQCMLLAGPGVVIGAALIGAAAKFTLPYGWDWTVAMLFGSILSATDPVAVVAIFGSLGVSPKLTLLVSGEALFNDGTAVVLFELLLMLALGSVPSAMGVVKFFARKTVLGPALGIALGNIAVLVIGKTSKGHFHSDATSQVVVSICCAYLAFILAELQLASSGVLAAVVAGVVMAGSAWHRFVDAGTIRTVWHTIEFVANTLIFVLAGILFGVVSSRWNMLQLSDLGYLFLLYLLVSVIRAIMLAMLWPLLNRVGPPVSFAEVTVMAWSGLRGAVGLLMAVIVDSVTSSHFKLETSSRIFFMVGGIAALTLLINGTLTPKVLELCGLTVTREEQEELVNEVKESVARQTREHLKEVIASATSGDLFSGVRPEKLADLVPALRSRGTPVNVEKQGNDEENEVLSRILCETLLREVKGVYKEFANQNVIFKASRAMAVLVDSVNEALISGTLCDWIHVKDALSIATTRTEADPAAPESTRAKALNEQRISALLAFIFAHEKGANDLAEHFGKTRQQIERDGLLKANKEQVGEARAALALLPEDLVTAARTKMLASRLLHFQSDAVSDLARRGLLSEDDASQLDHSIHHSMAHLEETPLAQIVGSSAR